MHLLLSLLLPEGIQQKWKRLMREAEAHIISYAFKKLAKFKVKLGIDIKPWKIGCKE